MKAAILAGGLGTRRLKRPCSGQNLWSIGGKPILWHIMKGYAHGITDFVICLGYKVIW